MPPITEPERLAYKIHPQGCMCAAPRTSEQHSTSPCEFCQEVARIAFNIDEQVQDR
jgi:hypothetical protein